MLRQITPLFLSSLCLLIAAQSYAQNACPSQASFDTNGSAIDASFTGVETGDVNGDGNLDALWLDPANGQVIIDYGDGQGGFIDSVTLSIPNSGSLVIGDVDNDNDPDLITWDPTLTQLVVYNGDGQGNLAIDPIPLDQAVGNPSERAFSLLDLDGDSLLDIVSTQSGTPDCVIVRLSTIGLVTPTSCLIDNSAGRLIAIDLNNDGTDEFVQSESGIIYSRSNMDFSIERDLEEELGFTEINAVYPRDVDGDGDVDIQVSGIDGNGPAIVNYVNDFITQCNDGNDNDNDNLIDLNDPSCSSSVDRDESEPSVETECSDGIDNDSDNDIDTADSACAIPGNTQESSTTCGTEASIDTVQPGTFTLNTSGESNDFSISCGAGGIQPNAAEKLAAFTVTQRSKVEIMATANTQGFDPYIYVLDSEGCNTGDVIACDKTIENGSTSILINDLSPGTYFVALSSSTIFGVDEGTASIDLTVTPINPLVLVSSGELCEEGVSPSTSLLAFGDFNGDGEPDALSIDNGERLTLIQEVCGNGAARLNEACDDGNLSNNDECLNTCELNTCGDGFLNEDAEECDDGNTVNDDECSNTCQLPVCGNNVLEFGEECDDGNLDADDACTDTCTIAICGDRVTRTDLTVGEADYEECDDGNDVDGDGCFQCQVSTQFAFVSFDSGSYEIGEMSNKHEGCARHTH